MNDTWDDVVYMPFGKHQGTPVGELPTDYIAWCLHILADLRPWLRHALEAEWKRRCSTHSAPPPSGQNGHAGDVGKIIDQWYRSLCIQHHPDRGGSTEVMQAINAAVEDLRKRLREASNG